jgi:regulator of sigma E protease
MDLLLNIFLIFLVILSFNFMIFIHELGHFLAARWRGLKIEKFQIWFGKPIWQKTINGVQYGLGSIPAGGFVSLPQMAPMETIEGSNQSDEPLPPVKPIDKIIVAVAGPLFSLGFALTLGLIVWGVGKPQDIIHETTIGYIKKDSPSDKAGMLVGDKVIAVDGKPVKYYLGGVEGVKENVVLSTKESIAITVEREGQAKPIELNCSFEIAPSRWFERRGLRMIGISFSTPLVVEDLLANSPGSKAGLLKGDKLVSVDGIKVWSDMQLMDYLKPRENQEIKLSILRKDQPIDLAVTPRRPCKPETTAEGETPAMLGVSWNFDGVVDEHIVHPSPIQQCTNSIKMMFATFTALLSPKSNIGIDQLSGPVSIAKAKFDILKTDQGLRRLLAFLVLINVNLAIFNMLPFPVLDGGHVTLALMEMVARRPVRARALEYLQSACALLLMGVFAYITFKDVGGFFTGESEQAKIEFCP